MAGFGPSQAMRDGEEQVDDDRLAAAMAVQAQWADAFEKRDLDRLVGLYAPQTAFWGSTNDLHKDSTGVLGYFTDLPRAFRRSIFEPPHVVPLGPDAMTASSYVVFVGEVDGEEVRRPYRMTHVLLRRDGRWRIATHHASPQIAG